MCELGINMLNLYAPAVLKVPLINNVYTSLNMLVS